MNTNHNKFTHILICILLIALTAFLSVSIYAKILEIRQLTYDLRYKETVNSTSDYPYEYIYKRLDRETGEIEVVCMVFDEKSGKWVTKDFCIDE